MLNRKPKKQQTGTDSFVYECEACGAAETIEAEVIAYFDEIDPGLPGQPATFACQNCPGIMFPQPYLRAKRAEAKPS